MHPQRLLHMTEQHIAELAGQIGQHRRLIVELSSQAEDVRRHEQMVENLKEAQALALMHRYHLLRRLREDV